MKLCAGIRRPHKMKEGKAIMNTLIGFPDFPGDTYQFGKDILRGTTVSRVGPAKIVSVLKCVNCGYSVTI